MRTTAAVSGFVESACLAPASRVLHTAKLLRRAALAAVAHDVPTLAQAVAYSSMVALFPALIVLAALLGMLPGSLPFRSQLGVFFLRVLPANVAPILDGYFSVAHPSQTLAALAGSLVVSLFGAVNVMATLMEGFRRAHNLPLLPRSFWLRRRRALALVPLSLLPMAGASLLVVFGNTLTHWLGRGLPPGMRPGFSVVSETLRWAIALGGCAAILGMIYHLGTDLTMDVRSRLEPWLREPWHVLRRGWTWRASVPGALVATLLWFVATLLFGYYVTRFANYTRVYGSLGAAMALLAWLYLIALCVLFGSEFNAQVARPEDGEEARAAFWRLPGWRRGAPVLAPAANAQGRSRIE